MVSGNATSEDELFAAHDDVQPPLDVLAREVAQLRELVMLLVAWAAWSGYPDLPPGPPDSSGEAPQP